jgi:CRISPR-associated protein Csm5
MISSIVELEVLSPLFIKGKDVEYGEGFIAVNNTVYLIDNDKLCKFIGEKTYDKNGIKREATPDYIDWYGSFIAGPENSDGMVDHYNNFARVFGRTQVFEINRVPEKYKKKSIDFFLIETGLITGTEREREKIVKEKLAKGVTRLSSSNEKTFIQNGTGVCFIPGSTIKGAIRNALLWKIMSEQEQTKQLESFVCSNLKKYAALQDEKKEKEFLKTFSSQAFGVVTLQSMSFEKTPEWNDQCQVSRDTFQELWQNANDVLKDYLRVVKVSDANFTTEPILEKKDVGTFCRNEHGEESIFALKIIINRNNEERPVITSLQTIKKDSKARFKITINDKLALQFFPNGAVPQYLKSVKDLLMVVHEFFQEVVSKENEYYEPLGRFCYPKQVKLFYDSLFPFHQPDTFRIRMGWGGGLMSKTQLLHLEKTTRSNVRNLIKNRQQQIAPKSRCLLIGENRQPLKPLGWCTLKVLDGVDFSYPGIAEYKHAACGKPTMGQPPGTVKAVIISAGQSAKVEIIEGDFLGAEIMMLGVQLRDFGLGIDSEVFLKLTVKRKQIVKVEYKGKA